MRRSKRSPIEACTGSLCSIRAECGRYKSDGRADYSVVPEFKIAVPRACVMMKEVKK